MTVMVLPLSDRQNRPEQGNEPLQVMVHIQAEVINPNLARRRANVWLTMNAGHLLMVKNPELVLGDPLQWRFDVLLSVPQHDHPGSVTQNRIGHIWLNALTGEIVEPLALLEELKANADSLATS